MKSLKHASDGREDISTHQLCEMTERSMDGVVPLDDILRVWHNIGLAIRSPISQKKGVRMSSLGTFTISKENTPLFIISPDLVSQFNVKQRTQPTPDNIPTGSLNFAHVVDSTNISRDLASKIYAKFITCLGRTIAEARNISLTLFKVAVINISDGELVCNFVPDYLRMFHIQNGAKSKPHSEVIRDIATKTSTNLYNDQIAKQRLKAPFNGNKCKTSLEIGDADNYSQNVRVNPNLVSRNPITGVGTDESTYKGRPRSASSSSLGYRGDMNSRRPSSAQSYRSTSSAGFSSRPPTPTRLNKTFQNGNQRSQSNGRLNKTQYDTPRSASQRNPREIAARALVGSQTSDVGYVDIIDKVRRKIFERGGSNGIHNIARIMKIMDDSGDGKLSKGELQYGLRDFGVDLNQSELEQVFAYFDIDHSGEIDFDEFLIGMKGNLPESRRKFVKMAFNTIDLDRSGTITTDEMLKAYDMSWNPDVRSGKKTPQEAVRDFMRVWGSNGNGVVTYKEFEDYYKGVSASIDGDDYFELMMRNAWRIAGGQGAAANTANKRVLVRNKDGSERIETVNNELGMRAKDMVDIRKRLGQQGINEGDVELYGGYDNTDKQARGKRPDFNRNGNNQSGRPHVSDYNQRPSGRHGSRPTQNNQNFGTSSNVPSAWEKGPYRGDQSSLPEDSPDRNRESSDRKGASFDAYARFTQILYSPPVSLEQLCVKLQVSVVSTQPRISMPALSQRLVALDPTLDRHQLKAIIKIVDPEKVGFIDVTQLHEFFVSRFGKDKTTSKNPSIVERVIKKILERCGTGAGIKGLQRSLSIMDDNGDKKLSKSELRYGLQDYGLDLSPREIDDIFSYFDRDKNGFITVDEFLIGVRGDLNDRRRSVVEMAFKCLDKRNVGYVTVQDMMKIYDVTQVPEVKAGRMTTEQAMRNFMEVWDENHDGTVTLDEFEDYYKGVSASIDGDDYFELMMRNAWRIAGGQGAAANTANKRVLVRNKDGSERIETVNNELGMRAKDMVDIRKRLGQQGINEGDVELYGGYDNTDEQALGKRPDGFSDQPRAAGMAPKSNRNSGINYHTELLKDQYSTDYQPPQRKQIIRPKGKSYIGF